MIEFNLPIDDKDIKEIAKATIEIGLYIWGDKYKVLYTGKVYSDKIVITFPEERDYTLFMLTWDAKNQWMTPKKI